MLSAIWTRRLQYAFIAIVTVSVGFSLYQWNASRASTNKTAPNNGLVGYWSFNEGTGTQAGDASVNKNTGTLTNGPTWGTGKLGQAVNLDGVNDYVSIPPSSNLCPTNISVSFWMRLTSLTTTTVSGGAAVNEMYPLSRRRQADDDDGYTFYKNDKMYFSINSYTHTAVGTTSVVAGQWYLVTGTYDGSNIRIYINGSLEGTTAYAGGAVSCDPSSGTIIGRRSLGNGYNAYFNGQIDEVRIYNRAISGTEVTNLYNLGAAKLNTSPTASLTSGLVGYWTFDGKDTPWSSSSAGTATDRSGNSNTGTLTNMSRATSTARGKLGQALYFDGSNDYVSVPSSGTFNISTTATYSAWVKAPFPSSSGSGYALMRKWVSGNEDKYITVGQTGQAGFYLHGVMGGTALLANTNLTSGVWNHIVGTYDGTTAKLYINGVLDNSKSASGDVADSNGTMAFGYSPNGNTSYLDGSLDEVRIYNRALSAGEVQSLYDLGASDKVNSSVSQSQSSVPLASGLVGYWKLDDASGTTARDGSANMNNGTLTGGPTWGTGQIGGDVVFDGVNDEVNIASPLGIGTGPLTIACWVYLTGNTNGAFVKVGNNVTGTNNGFGIGVGATDFDTSGNNLIGLYEQVAWKLTGVTIGTNAWHQVVMRVNSSGSSTSDYFKDGVLVSSLGASTGVAPTVQTFIGGYTSTTPVSRHPAASIDEVRVYNRALSDDEISQLYRISVDTSLKGYWSFDGSATNWTSSSAGTVADLSGNGNTGTMTNMNRATSTARGKVGQALNFDGVDDYIPVTGTQSVQNVSYWIKPDTSIYSKYSMALSGTKRYFLNNGLYSGTNTATRYINAVAPSAESLGSEILSGTFESGGLGSWYRYFQGGAGGSANVTSSAPYAGTYSADFNSYGGSALWHAVFYDQNPISVTAGTLYKFQFAAKGSIGKNGLNAFLQQGGSPWMGINLSYTFDVTTSWVLHTFYFYADFTDSNIQPYFATGGLGGFDLYLDNISLKPVNSVGDVTTGAWNFVSVNLDSPVTADSIVLGLGSGYLKGTIDEVRIYNRALSTTEITALYNSGR